MVVQIIGTTILHKYDFFYRKPNDLDDYNERLVKRNLNELIYVIDTDEIDLKKEKEINDILYSLFPPRGGLTEMYVADDDREKMNKINDELGELKKKLANYELI